jgi:hypothetical protein
MIELIVVGWLQVVGGEPQPAAPPAAPAAVEQSTAQASSATAPATGDSERQICRRTNRPNSRLGARVCRTAQEWRDEEERNREWLEEAQRSGSINCCRRE